MREGRKKGKRKGSSIEGRSYKIPYHVQAIITLVKLL